MAQQVYLGIDLGAESGRVMAGLWDGKKMQLEELHRFANGGVNICDTLRWNTINLWAEIQNGLIAAGKKYGKSVVSAGVDTWGVDYALLSKSGEVLGFPFHYRDARTRGGLQKAFARVPREEIFAQTGLQFMELNSLYQLLALQEASPEILAAAETLLFMPDFLHYCLSGAKVAEFTIATTSQCVNPKTRTWATDLLNKFGLPTNMFPEIVPPGTRIGSLRPGLAERTGLGPIGVVAPAAHDTGSAVAAVPVVARASCPCDSGSASKLTGKMPVPQPNWAYLSSGTWSLLGVEVQEALLSPRVLELNITNEGGVDGTYRLLKNIMGLWLVQQCRRAFIEKGKDISYEQLAKLAAEAPAFRSLVNPNDDRFLNPPSMPAAIQEFCRETGQPIPETEGQFARCVFESLALTYASVLDNFEELTGTPIEVIHIVGGGSRNKLLNTFAASACGRPVVAGPVEGTVLGNLLVQARSSGEIKSLADLRTAVRESSEVEHFEPKNTADWQEARDRFAKISKHS